MTLSNTLYYIRGRGYYEQFKDEEIDWVDYSDYNIPPIVVKDAEGNPVDTITSGDLVRQKWVVKNQYGFNPCLEIKHESGEFSIGGAFYLFDSRHWGQVIWAEGVNSDVISPRNKYYEYFGDKFSGSIYTGENYHFTDRLDVSLNIQTRYIRYSFDQTPMGAFDKDYSYDLDWFFLSPRSCVTYRPSDRITLSTSAAISSRIPTDEAIYDADHSSAVPSLDVKPERAYDFEIGGSYKNDNAELGINLYWMDFRNEIIPEGGIDDAGKEITVNVDRSVHAGVELNTGIRPIEHLSLNGNFSVSYDRAKDFKITQKLYDDNWNHIADTTLDYSDNPIAGFPTYLGNLLADYQYDRYRFAARSRIVGRQYIENSGDKDLSIDPYVTFSASVSAAIANPAGFGRLMLSGRVDNLFNKKYETSGAAEIYWFRDSPAIRNYYYIPAAERSFFLQLKLELD